MVVVALHCAAPVVAQDVRPAQTNPSVDDGGRTQDELPVSLDRIKRALDRPAPTDGHARLLDFIEFVVVVGTAPDVPLFEEGDFSGGPVGSMHAEMMAAVRPSRMDQAVGSDSLGVATAALFSLVPPAVRAIAGWFAGDEDVAGPGWAGYTAAFVLGTDENTPPAEHTLAFHRLAGQRVALHTRVADTDSPGVLVRVDGHEWRILREDVVDHTIPETVLDAERVGNMHRLTISQAPGSYLQGPRSVGLLVVVHEAEEP